MAQPITITAVRHPHHLFSLPDWNTWRLVWEGGDRFTEAYLRKLSKRESVEDFNQRRDITPVPSFAKAAVTDIKNAVFHRMIDITRRGGSKNYQESVAGFKGGIDRRGSSMNNFIGTQLLPELLSMGKVGVFVDNTPNPGLTLADAKADPYLYLYRVEDILSWECSYPEQESDFQAVLLRDWCISYESTYAGVALPKGSYERYRMVWIGEDGYVRYQFFDTEGMPITSTGEVYTGAEPVKLSLTKIPFVLFDIGDSLLRDISKHQIALLNLVSSDVSYALKANFPFYTEQQDLRAAGSHLKNDVMEDGTSSSGGQKSADKNVKVGTVDGRIYGPEMDRPDFIHPSPEPLLASMKLQEKLENDIRKLVNLAVVSLGNSRASGEARAFDNQGLESGLSFIGMVLEKGERRIADHWAGYEGNDTRDSIVITYPSQYSLKSTKDRLEEADKLTDLMFSIPGRTVKKELAKDAVASLLGGRVTPEKLTTIFNEIDNASYSTSSPEVIQLAKEQGLACDITLSDALGFDGKDEIPKANEDHAARIARIQESQIADNAEKPGARGIKDLAPSQTQGKEERQAATDTTLSDSSKKPQRGKGKKVE